MILTCPYCGRVFAVEPWRLKRRPVIFCSTSCAVKARPSSAIPIPVDEVVRLYVEDGLTLKQIGQRVGVSLVTIANRLDKAGVPRRKPPGPVVTEEWRAMIRATHPRGEQHPNFKSLPIDEITRAYESGESVEFIGARLGVSGHCITDKLRLAGRELRRRGFPGGWRVTKDGHRVQSGWEVIVDDWLSDHAIPHDVHPLLPFGQKQLGDFLVGDRYVEMWGVVNNPKYDAKRLAKVANYRAHGLTLIEITSTQVVGGDFSPLSVLLQ